MVKKKRGLYRKYKVEKVEGPTDPDADYIVLRIDSGEYVEACRGAVFEFAKQVASQNPTLARDLRQRIADYEDPSDFGDMDWMKPDCEP